jgi:hypothetical protein
MSNNTYSYYVRTHREQSLDVVSSEADERPLLPHEGDHDVDEVRRAVLRRGARRVEVLVDDEVEEGVQVPEHLLAARGGAREEVHQPAGGVGEVVLGGEAGLGAHGLVDDVVEVLLVRELLRAVDVPQRHRADDAEDVVLHVHGFPAGAG